MSRAAALDPTIPFNVTYNRKDVHSNLSTLADPSEGWPCEHGG